MGVFHFFKIVQVVPNRATHHMLSAWVDINIQGHSLGQTFCGTSRIPNGFKIPFYPMENENVNSLI